MSIVTASQPPPVDGPDGRTSAVAVLLAHGSPDPRSGAAVREAARVVAMRTGSAVRVAFLDHDSPDLTTAVAGLAASDDVVVLPLLLSAAFHARVDVPAAVAELDRTVTLLPPLGHPAALLDSLLLRAAGPVAVVAAGTRVDDERSAFTAAVGAASRRTGVAASAAFATGPGPSAADALSDRAVVIPWLLAPGRLLDSVRRVASGRRIVGDHLLAEPLLLDEIVERLAHAPVAAPG
jgi:sirohydrochlorin ferrochelatase